MKMREKDYKKLITKSFTRRVRIHEKKNNDYADQSECLGNFKRVAIVLDNLNIVPGCTAEKVALIYAILKIDRFSNLRFAGKQALNESISDTIDDLKNYLDLLEACVVDQDSA